MADLPRFFLPGADFTVQELTICEEVLHHLRTVLRLSVGDQVTFLDGLGACCQARLNRLDRRQGLALIMKRWQEQETALPITLLQALPKGDKLDLVLQKGTELGITAFQPVLTRHSVAIPDPGRAQQRHQRWQRIVQEAARQSHRSHLPEVKPLAQLDAVLQGSHETLKLVCWEEGACPLRQALPATAPTSAVILIGPEGGFAADEVEKIVEQGFTPVHLGPRILRTETAGLAATSILQYLYGDLHLTASKNTAQS